MQQVCVSVMEFELLLAISMCVSHPLHDTLLIGTITFLKKFIPLSSSRKVIPLIWHTEFCLLLSCEDW